MTVIAMTVDQVMACYYGGAFIILTTLVIVFENQSARYRKKVLDKHGKFKADTIRDKKVLNPLDKIKSQ